MFNFSYFRDHFLVSFSITSDKMAPKAVAPPKKNVPKKIKVKKPKKLNLRFVLDCTTPVEDGVLDMVSFVS
jgi:hypothetical protein